MTTPGATTLAEAQAAEFQKAVVELAVSSSIEMGAHRPEDAVRIAELLPAGTPVYVNHLPRHGLDDTLRGLLAVSKAGLEPVPHIAARRVGSRSTQRAATSWRAISMST